MDADPAKLIKVARSAVTYDRRALAVGAASRPTVASQAAPGSSRLATPGACAADGAGAAEPDRTDRLIAMPIGNVFWLVNEFRSRCQDESETAELATLLGAIVQFAGHIFELAQRQHKVDTRLHADGQRCLGHLRDLARSLVTSGRPSRVELVHSLDGLIVQLVLADEAFKLAATLARLDRADSAPRAFALHQ